MSLNWFASHRQAWIAESLRVYGFINRDHLVRKFGISVAQSSLDLRVYQAANPDGLSYDKTLKRYVSKEPSP